MAVRLAPSARQQFLDTAGNPYVGAKLFTYLAGTSTKQATYTTSAGDVANTNPIILDASGRTPSGLWLTEGADYKFLLAPAYDTDPPASAIYTEDWIRGVNDSTTLGESMDSLAAAEGSSLIGWIRGAVGTVATTLAKWLGWQPPTVFEFMTDAQITDARTLAPTLDLTAAFQAAANVGGDIRVPGPAVYIIDSVSLTKSVSFHCEPGVVFKRKDSADLASGSYWIAGASMFEVDAAGLTVEFSGSYKYDGNNANQTTTEPTGSFCKCYPPSVITGEPTVLRFGNGEFTNGTSSYLLLRGDDVNRRYETLVDIDNCRFYDTVKGKGKGDPSTPNPLGYLPTYVYVMDYVRINTQNFHAEWNGALTTGEYAACALNGTFFGSVYANSGESYIYMHGTTYVKGLGRSAKKYNDDLDWVTNNGIGAIDCYGNADTLFIEKLVAVDCENVPARAKGSLKAYTVLDASLTDCHRGLQVGPSTTGACETVVTIGSVRATGGTIPQLEFVGTSSDDVLPSVTIGSAYVSGTQTNPEGLTSTDGTVRVKNVGKLQAGTVGLFGALTAGMSVHTVTRSSIDSLVINAAGGEGLIITAGDSHAVKSFDIRSTTASAISINTNPGKVVLRDGKVNAAVDYAVFSNTTTTHITIDSVDVDTVTGNGRGFYTGGGPMDISNCKTTAVATPLFAVTGALVNESANSWNAVTRYGTFAMTTTGTWRVGDIVWDSAPAAGGAIGWICTTAGTPGTWKTFGAIAA